MSAAECSRAMIPSAADQAGPPALLTIVGCGLRAMEQITRHKGRKQPFQPGNTGPQFKTRPRGQGYQGQEAREGLEEGLAAAPKFVLIYTVGGILGSVIALTGMVLLNRPNSTRQPDSTVKASSSTGCAGRGRLSSGCPTPAIPVTAVVRA